MVKLEPLQQEDFERFLEHEIRSYAADHVKNGDWVQVKEQKAFIFDFVIDQALRGKGFGGQALAAMEEKLESMNVESVGPHVFGDNLIAQALYKKAGFEVTGIHMRSY
jgi:ribosomal protein S18 acetylase RimI-like enzyme